MKLFKLTLALALISSSASQGFASIQPKFQLDSGPGSGTISGSTFTLVSPGLVADGVTFTATLTVIGNGTGVEHNAGGLGVKLGSASGSRINTGESLAFSLSIDAVMGGTVSFDGFTSLDFNSFSTSNDGGFFSLDAILDIGDTDLTLGTFNSTGEYALPLGPVPQFTIFGTAGSFQLDDVTAQFTGAMSSVPEPTSLLVWSMLGVVGLKRRRHKA